METQDFEESSGRWINGKHVPGQVGTCACMKETNRLAEKELLNGTFIWTTQYKNRQIKGTLNIYYKVLHIICSNMYHSSY